MKKSVFIVVCLVVVATTFTLGILFFTLDDAPVGSVKETNIAKYKEVNPFVQNKLQTGFKGSLPTEIPTEGCTGNYCYTYHCALVGDPNFMIYLELTYDDKEQYFSAKQQISMSEVQDIIQIEDKEYYVLQADNLQMYLDDIVQDGLQYIFEIVVLDSTKNEITYLSAYQWDSAEKSDEMKSVLLPIAEYANI